MKDVNYGFDIELTHLCNANCSFCPHDLVKRKRAFMDRLLLDKILMEIAHLSETYKVLVGFVGMGEPLLQNDLFLYALDILSRHDVQTILVTNGTYIHKVLSHPTLGKLDSAVVSFTGHDKASYESIQGLDYDEVMANIELFHETYPDKLRIACLSHDDLIENEQPVIELWQAKGINFSFTPLHTRGGFLQWDQERPIHPVRFPCKIFRNISFIACDGNVLSCCHDIQCENILGNLNELPLNDILIRKKRMIDDRQPGFRICNYCNDRSFS